MTYAPRKLTDLSLVWKSEKRVCEQNLPFVLPANFLIVTILTRETAFRN